MRRRSFARLLLALAFVLFASASLAGCREKSPAPPLPPSSATEAPVLVVKLLDVGQGEAILIRTREQTVLVDTGDVREGQKLRERLNSEGVETIDKLIITHPHRDHLGGAPVVFRTYRVRSVYDNGQGTKQKLYINYRKAIEKRGLPYRALSDGDVLDLGGGATLHVLSPTRRMVDADGKSGEKPDLNLNSIVARLDCGAFRMLLTSDATAETEAGLLLRHGASALRAEVLKAPHHGSRTSSGALFLKAVSPAVAVISCGADNEYHLPHTSVRRAYQKLGADYYRTDRNGTITVETDGRGYTVRPERGEKNDMTEN